MREIHFRVKKHDLCEGKRIDFELKWNMFLPQCEWRPLYSLISGLMMSYDMSNKIPKPYDNTYTSFGGS